MGVCALNVHEGRPAAAVMSAGFFFLNLALYMVNEIKDKD